MSRKLVGIIAAVVIGGASAFFQALDRNATVSSPARQFVAEPCAQYREIVALVEEDPDHPDAGLLWVTWANETAGDFERAAVMDPELAEAAASVRWLSDVLADPDRLAASSDQEFEDREAPVYEACFNGPGRE